MRKYITVGNISITIANFDRVQLHNKRITIFHYDCNPFVYTFNSKREAEQAYVEIGRKLDRIRRWERIVRFFTGKKNT